MSDETGCYIIIKGGVLFQPEVEAFEIDERTFYAIDEEGHMLDDDMDDVEVAAAAAATTEGGEPSSSNGAAAAAASAVEFNEDLFDADDLPDSEDDSDEEDDEQKRPADGIANLQINGDG